MHIQRYTTIYYLTQELVNRYTFESNVRKWLCLPNSPKLGHILKRRWPELGEGCRIMVE